MKNVPREARGALGSGTRDAGSIGLLFSAGERRLPSFETMRPDSVLRLRAETCSLSLLLRHVRGEERTKQNIRAHLVSSIEISKAFVHIH